MGKFLGQFLSVKEFPEAKAGDTAFDLYGRLYCNDGEKWVQTSSLFADEVKFRGQAVDTGKFVYGYLSKRRNVDERPALLKYCIDYEEGGIMMSTIVHPQTITQLAFRDADGAEVYFGDTVRRSNEKNYEVVRGKWGILLVRDGEVIDRGHDFGVMHLVRSN